MANCSLEMIIGQDETILWKGRPDKKCFLLECVFNPMLPFALIWGLIDLVVIGISAAHEAMLGKMFGMLIFFFAIHLMPVWIYLIGIAFSFRKYKNTAYVITDKGIYASKGIFSYTYEMKPFTDLSHINIRRGIFDQWLGVGDVISECAHQGHSSGGITISDIPDYQKVFSMLRQLQTDIYADTMYPNDLRPKENHGYQTSYRKNDFN